MQESLYLQSSKRDLESCYITAVVVTFHPDKNILQQLIDSIALQVQHIVVVDNGSLGRGTPACPDSLQGDFEVIYLPHNQGVGEAQNRGIAWAQKHISDYVLLLDQDSLPAPNMVARLVTSLHKLLKEGKQVAAVGPDYNRHAGEHSDGGNSDGIKAAQVQPQSSFWYTKGWSIKFHRRPVSHEDNARVGAVAVPVDCLISSGSLIPLAVLETVGVMNAELFIDCVDFEWCLRAASLGYQAFGVFDAHMEHCLGEGVTLLLGRSMTQYSPLRRYYWFRNMVWLCRQQYVPKRWGLLQGVRLCAKYMLYPCLAKQSWCTLKMESQGIIDGLQSKLGSHTNS